MRQEDSILLLCTEADAANASIQKWQKCDSSNFISDPGLVHSLACCLVLLYSCIIALMITQKKMAHHVLISLISHLQVKLVRVAERRFTYGVYL